MFQKHIWYWSILWMTQKISNEQYIKSNLDLWQCDLIFNWIYLFGRSKTCPKQASKVLKDIERTTQWAENRGLTLTFEHVTWKSIRIIYSLRATPAPSLVLIKWKGQKILSGQHLVYSPTDRPIDINWPTDRCKTIFPFFKVVRKRTILNQCITKILKASLMLFPWNQCTTSLIQSQD